MPASTPRIDCLKDASVQLKIKTVEHTKARPSSTRFIVDMYGAHRLDDLKHIERTLKRCADVAGATLLHVHLHPCEADGDVSGVAVALDSHMAIHTSPGSGYATLDLIMTGPKAEGSQSPKLAAEVLRGAFKAREIVLRELVGDDETRSERVARPVRKRPVARQVARLVTSLEQAA